MAADQAMARALAMAPADPSIEHGAPLAPRQEAVLRLISDYRAATGETPTTSFLARRLNLHHATVQEHLARLHRKGWLRSPTPGGLP